MFTYEDKLAYMRHPVSCRLLDYVTEKQSNLAVAADLTRAEELLAVAEAVAEHIVVLKTHIDIVEDFTPELTRKLRTLADQHGFLLFEDRKFADIGHTVMRQFRHGIYRIADWADLINAHTLPGEGVIQGLKAGRGKRDIGLLLMAQMSSHGNLFTEDYRHRTIKMAEDNRDFVTGFIAQARQSPLPDMLTFTPGVQLHHKTDDLSQRYCTPEVVIGERHNDIMIVGRGIYQADSPGQAAAHYHKAGWHAYRKAVAQA